MEFRIWRSFIARPRRRLQFCPIRPTVLWDQQQQSGLFDTAAELQGVGSRNVSHVRHSALYLLQLPDERIQSSGGERPAAAPPVSGGFAEAPLQHWLRYQPALPQSARVL